MSAYVVEVDHIDYLVTAAVLYRTLERSQDRSKETATGRLLLEANRLSVAHLYRCEPTDELPGPVKQTMPADYQYRPVNPDRINPVQVLKALRCYRYQTCEHPDYLGSDEW
jgi:hypothetical protein